VRGTALIVIGLVMGAMLIEPAVAHLTTFSHLKEHFYTKEAANKKFGKLVAAGVHIKTAPNLNSPPAVDRSFGFSATNRVLSCTVDNNWVATRDAICTPYVFPNGTVAVEIFDTGTGSGPAGLTGADFWVIAFGPGV
jgi:hypothetical protein